MRAPIPIRAAAALALAATEPPTVLEPLMHTATRQRIRRLNRLSRLGIIGAQRCTAALPSPLDPQTAVYVGSAEGNIADTVSMVRDLHENGTPPMPVSFINVSTNMTGFNVARGLGLSGINLAASRDRLPFEAVLDLAGLDLAAGSASAALVGCVDECAWPLEEHRRRLGLPPGAALAEGSSWLLLGDGPGPALAEVDGPYWFEDRRGLDAFLETDGVGDAGFRLATGASLAAGEEAGIAHRLGEPPRYPYREGFGYLGSITAWGIARFIESNRGHPAGLLHVDRDTRGRYVVIKLRTLPA
ncbi:hypothetical protein [Thiohalospira sp.]|uniref:hypothetical protein n=1 Tax=Thiohalospira sp. TaxID=3080549 RepID=UPI00397EB7DA